ncbi:MAG: hypothetical protein KGZ43_05440 [Sulfuritalea sp.]|nr:hypothetical protein [Sulfuritalea sp.]
MNLPFDDLALATTILDYNAEFHMRQFHFITNRRARQVGIKEPIPGTVNVLTDSTSATTYG